MSNNKFLSNINKVTSIMTEQNEAIKKDWSHILNVSLSKSKVKASHIEAAQGKIVEITGDSRYSRSELICDCIEFAFAEILKAKGLTDEQIEEIYR